MSPDLNRQGIREYLAAMETAGLMRKDQCTNVEDKVKSSFLEKAYERMGCLPQIARACVEKTAATCECTKE